MNIAICDDEKAALQNLESFIHSVLEKTTYDYSYKSFTSGDMLLDFLKFHHQYFQIYLLDIEMSGTDGLKTAAKIRREDEDAVIIFVTSHAELMPQAFRVLAFDYIIKPFDAGMIKKVVLSAIERLESRNKLYTYKIQKVVHTVYRSQIEYIESFGRKAILHLAAGDQIEYNGTLKDALIKTGRVTFAQPHNSFIVNFEKIARMESHQIMMRSGILIPVSRKFHAAFHAAYRDYILTRQ